MILYHFTRPELLRAIEREGLIASNNNPANDLTNSKPVVWLTERPSLMPTNEHRKMLLDRGTLIGPKCYNLGNATVCLAVEVSRKDRRLKKFLHWKRSHPRANGLDPNSPFAKASWKHDWVYFGDIPSERITVFKRIKECPPPWVLPTMKRQTIDIDGERGVMLIPIRYTARQKSAMLAGLAGPPDYMKAIKRHLAMLEKSEP